MVLCLLLAETHSQLELCCVVVEHEVWANLVYRDFARVGEGKLSDATPRPTVCWATACVFCPAR